MIKKCIAVILCAAAFFSAAVFASDKQLSSFITADLYKFGIMAGDGSGNLNLGEPLTRAQAAKIICTAGNAKLSEKTEQIFPDVTSEHWAYKYIAAAKKSGIVCGDSAGNFNPDAPVTNEEFIKMTVSLLGYEPRASRLGGFPAGYTAAAQELGITDGMHFGVNKYALREDAAKIIYNALDVPVMEQIESDGGSAEEFIIMNGSAQSKVKTLRSAFSDIWDTSRDNINNKAQKFASQYPYKAGDTEKSFALYPDITYSSGIERKGDASEYECPALYDDELASALLSTMEWGYAEIIVNGEKRKNKIQYALLDMQLFIPADILSDFVCTAEFDRDTYVLTLSSGDTTLEIIPNIIGMRKNRAEGYYVPLKYCARFIDNKLFVPADAVLKEFGVTLGMVDAAKVIEISWQ